MMSRPVHIQPEWYFLFAYAILRRVPNKIAENILEISRTELPTACSWFLLTLLGASSVEAPYILMSQLFRICYFGFIHLSLQCWFYSTYYYCYYCYWLVIIGTIHAEKWLPANMMSRPVHIQPEWYFLFAYAILRRVPNKIAGGNNQKLKLLRQKESRVRILLRTDQ